jgi:hypothetical protein
MHRKHSLMLLFQNAMQYVRNNREASVVSYACSAFFCDPEMVVIMVKRAIISVL